MLQYEIFRVVSRFPRCISCYIAESPFPLKQCLSSSIYFLVSVHILQLVLCHMVVGLVPNGCWYSTKWLLVQYQMVVGLVPNGCWFSAKWLLVQCQIVGGLVLNGCWFSAEWLLVLYQKSGTTCLLQPYSIGLHQLLYTSTGAAIVK